MFILPRKQAFDRTELLTCSLELRPYAPSKLQEAFGVARRGVENVLLEVGFVLETISNFLFPY